MERYAGFVDNDGKVVYEIRLPTHVRDPLRLEVCAWKCKGMTGDCKGIRGKELAKIYVPIKSFPRWDVSYQAYFLSRSADRALRQATDELVEKLGSS